MPEEQSNVRSRKRNTKVTPDEKYFEGTGKTPPQATEFEESVVGALMLEKDAIYAVADFLKPEHFYNEKFGEIYKAIKNLSDSRNPIDMNTVAEQLSRNGKLTEVGGIAELALITNRVASTAHVEFHARIVSEKFLQRELIRVGAAIQRDAFDESQDVAELLQKASHSVFELENGYIKKEVSEIGAVLRDAYDQLEKAAKSEGGMSGVPSGYTELDKITAGWHPSDLVIIAARPAMGKTAFVLSMARNIAINNEPVAVFSLEMSSVQLVNRIVSAEARIESEKMKTGKLDSSDWQRLTDKMEFLSKTPMYIDDTPALSVTEFRTKMRRLVERHKIKIAIIDYLQLMTAGGNFGSREQEVSTISRNLKAIAKEMNVPIIALSQLSRAVESRGGDKRPQLSDLRESGAIEQDADMVMFIHRPEYYHIDTDESGRSLKGIAEIIIAKHRSGAVGSVYLKFISQYTRFENADDSDANAAIDEMNNNVIHSKMNSAESEGPSQPEPMPVNNNFGLGDSYNTDDNLPF